MDTGQNFGRVIEIMKKNEIEILKLKIQHLNFFKNQSRFNRRWELAETKSVNVKMELIQCGEQR